MSDLSDHGNVHEQVAVSAQNNPKPKAVKAVRTAPSNGSVSSEWVAGFRAACNLMHGCIRALDCSGGTVGGGFACPEVLGGGQLGPGAGAVVHNQAALGPVGPSVPWCGVVTYPSEQPRTCVNCMTYGCRGCGGGAGR